MGDDPRGGRFGRMFPFLPARDPGGAAIDELVKKMAALAGRSDGPPNTKVPAGYTYLGQFIDHDLTFEPTSRFGRDNEPSALVNFRTPRLDLDSLYGAGPVDQPYLYDWCCEPRGAKLLVTTNPAGCELARVDLARNTQGRALTGDKRNDENLILSQLHLLFVRFHNAVVDRLVTDSAMSGMKLFEQARQIVRWHYQWIVVHDFLRKIVGDLVADSVTPRPAAGSHPAASTGTRRLYPWRSVPVIPVEFSAAAYRFGHSMVRPAYKLNDKTPREVPIFPDPEHPDDPIHLGGFRPLPCALEIDWDRFFPEHGVRIESKKIDHFLARPLFELPFAFTGGEIPPGADGAAPAVAPKTIELARLNMHRGRALGLPAGADVARALGHPPLTRKQLFPLDLELDDATMNTLEPATPLWYYLLREAATYGKEGHVGGSSIGFQLGPTGGRIVAEVLVGLLECDPQSYVNTQPAWTPTDSCEALSFTAANPSTFTMPDLLTFTLGPSHA